MLISEFITTNNLQPGDKVSTHYCTLCVVRSEGGRLTLQAGDGPAYPHDMFICNVRDFELEREAG